MARDVASNVVGSQRFKRPWARAVRSGTAALALLALLAVPAVAVADDPPLIEQPLPAVDTVNEAAMLAKATNQPVMVNEETTGENAIFLLPDGSRVAEMTSEPVRVPDPNDPAVGRPST